MLINGSAVNTTAVNSYYQLIEYLLGIASYAYSTTADTTLTATVVSDASYSIGTDSKVTAAIYTGVAVPSNYAITTTGTNRSESRLSGGSSFGYVVTGVVTPLLMVSGNSSYNISTTGSIKATIVTGPSSVSYVISTQSNQTVIASVGGDSSYQVSELSRANVIKYSQEVLEEFACVTYNIEMVDNVFVVSPIENSVTADATIVFEVNKC